MRDLVDLHSNVVPSEENEQERDDGSSNGRRTRRRKRAAQASDNNKADQHDTRRGQEEEATAQSIDASGCGHGPEQVPHIEACRDESLIRDGLNTNGSENKRKIVTNYAISCPLRQYAERD